MRILTFDIEEWFHLLDHESTRTENDWKKFPSRIQSNMEVIFEILEGTQTRATFFVLGWIAEKYPTLIRDISEMGFEIGSHTHLHQLVYTQRRNDFHNDVERSIKTLEDITGEKVRSFRAPGFSITESNKWAFDVLYQLGIQVDSSVFPASRAHGGLRVGGFSGPTILEHNGVKLMEFPISTIPFMGKKFVFSGGGYFRVSPYWLIKRLSKKSSYIMSYFHPRDFDFGQPIIGDLNRLRRFKSYAGIEGCEAKLRRWLNDFSFCDLKSAQEEIDWDQVNTIKL